MLAALLGASKGIGYGVLCDLISKPENEVVLLLRKPDCFDEDLVVSAAIQSGRVKVVQGDATRPADVAKLFDHRVDVVVTSVGGTPTFTLQGFKLTDPIVCTSASSALISTLSRLPVIPRVVVVSSMGIGAEHDIMPLPLRILYPWMLSGPHADKEGLEYLYQRAARALPTPAIPPPTNILPDPTTPESVLPQVIIIRPALLMDGPAKGRPALKAQEGLATYTCRRNDVSQFIVTECLPGTDEWANKCPVLGY